MNKVTLLTAAALLALPNLLPAALVITYNGPNSQASTVAGVSTITFDEASLLGSHNGGLTFTGIGSFNNIDVVAPNTFGGSSNTDYGVVGVPSNSTSSTLTFITPEAYVGFEWLAVDALNSVVVNFTGGGSQTITSASPNAALGACPAGAYCGNPNDRTKDPSENFAYVNLIATGGSTISSISFNNTNTTQTGFEFDSISVTTTPQTPEPMSMALTLSGLVAAGFFGRKRFLKS